eukprot:6995577-Alexandrium_andersonii.AAC.1
MPPAKAPPPAGASRVEAAAAAASPGPTLQPAGTCSGPRPGVLHLAGGAGPASWPGAGVQAASGETPSGPKAPDAPSASGATT